MHCHALNYTATCVPDLERAAEAFAREKMPMAALATRSLMKWLQDAQHFVLPDGGRLFDDNLRGLQGRKLRLPYPQITVEYFVDQTDENRQGTACSRRIAVAQEVSYATIDAMFSAFALTKVPRVMGDQRALMINAVGYCDPAKVWIPQMAGVCVSETWGGDGDSKLVPPLNGKHSERDKRERSRIGIVPVPFLGEMYRDYVDRKGENGLHDAMNDVADETCAVLELCEALTCVNVHVEKLQAVPKAVNDKRAACGKLRLPDAWCLTVDVPVTLKRSEWQGGTHRSPRTHLRRGHIRRLDSGNVWVNSTVVGSGAVKIDKHYHLQVA